MRLGIRNRRLTLFLILIGFALISVSPGTQPAIAQESTPTETPLAPLPLPSLTLTEIPSSTPMTTPSATATASPSETPTETLIPVPSDTAAVVPSAEVTDEPTPIEVTATATNIPTAETTDEPLPTEETITATPTITEIASPMPTLPPEPPLALLVGDTLDTGISDFWTLGAGWSLVASEAGQALQVANSHEPVTSGTNTLFDQVAQLRFRTKATAGATFRLAARASAVGSYDITIDPDGQIVLYRAGAVVQGTLVNLSPDTWHMVRLSAIGSAIRVVLDDVEVMAWTDTAPLPPGQIMFNTVFSPLPEGAGPAQNTLLVDDLFVWIPANEQPVTTPTATTILEPTLTATPTAEMTVTPTPTALPLEPSLELIFTDNFDMGETVLWTLTGAAGFVPSEGGQALQIETGGKVTFVNPNVNEAAVAARVQVQTGVIRLSLRESAAGRYTATLNADGTVSLYRNNALWGVNSIAPLLPDSWHTLRLSALEGTVRVAVDEVEVIAVQDATPLPMGTVSFEADGRALVDDFGLWIVIVTGPTPTPAASLPPSSMLSPVAPAAPDQQGLNLIFHEGFQRGGGRYYRTFLGPKWPVIEHETNYSLQISGEPSHMPTQLSMVSYLNVAVQAEFLFTQGVARIGVRHSPSGSYAALLRANGVVELYRSGQLISSTSVLPNESGHWRTLQVSAIENTVRVLVDGELAINFVDNVPLSRGTIHIAAENLNNSLMHIDDINVWTAPSPEQSQSAGYIVGESGGLLASVLSGQNLETNEVVTVDVGNQYGGSIRLFSYYEDLSPFYPVGTNVIEFPTLPAQVYQALNPKWAPANGRRIAFQCSLGVDDIDGNSLCLFDIDTNILTDITPGEWLGVASDFSWSPDGQWMVIYATGLSHPYGLSIYNPYTQSPPTHILNGYFDKPFWHTDDYIYFRDGSEIKRFYYGGGIVETVVADGVCGIGEFTLVSNTIAYRSCWADQFGGWHYNQVNSQPVSGGTPVILLGGVANPDINISSFDYLTQEYPRALTYVSDDYVSYPQVRLLQQDGTPSDISLASVSEPYAFVVNVNTQVLYKIAPPTPTPIPTPDCAAYSPARSQIEAQLATYRVFVLDICEEAVPDHPEIHWYWTDEELEGLLLGVQNTAHALNLFSTVYSTDVEAFTNVLLFDPATDKIEFEQLNNYGEACETTKRSPADIATGEARATINCGGNNIFTQYTAAHELGHVFLHQTAFDTSIPGATVTPCPLSSGGVGFIGCMDDPNLADSSLGNAAKALRGSDSETQFVFGLITRWMLPGDVQTRIDNFDPNGDYEVSQADFPPTICADGSTPAPECPADAPLRFAQITDWERGETGWDIVIAVDASDKFGACDNSGRDYVITPFQQNPCVIYEWVLENSDAIDAGDVKTLKLVEQEEAGADMFLNWVYRTVEGAASQAYGNNEALDQQPTGRLFPDCDLVPSGHGDDRFCWMRENLRLFFIYYGW